MSRRKLFVGLVLSLAFVLGGCFRVVKFSHQTIPAAPRLTGLPANWVEVQVRDWRPDQAGSSDLAQTVRAGLVEVLAPATAEEPPGRHRLSVDIIEHRSFNTPGNWNALTRFRVSLFDPAGRLRDSWEARGEARQSNLWGSMTPEAVLRDSYHGAVADMMSHLATVSLGAGPAGSREPAGPARQAAPALGSALLLGPSGVAATSYHLLEGAKRIELFFPAGNRTYEAELLLKNVRNNVALLRIRGEDPAGPQGTRVSFVLADSSTVKVGQEVFTLGYPWGGEVLGKAPQVSPGIISATTGPYDDPRLVQITNRLHPGHSGGPLFNRRGELVGLVLAGVDIGYFYNDLKVLPQGLNFALKIDYLRSLVAMVPGGGKIIHERRPGRARPLDEQVRRLGPFVAVLRVYR